jgi:hypothetical protein
MNNKKASLSLSITAIVVIVIAFVVLGLGLTLTRTIFKGAQDKLPEAFAVTQLESEPTSENTITIPKTVEVDREKSKTMDIGFYNKGESTATGATFDIIKCLTKENRAVTENLPLIASPSEDVGKSDARGFSIIITEKGLDQGTYICTVGVKCGEGATCPNWAKDIDGKQVYDSKQFFLSVIA